MSRAGVPVGGNRAEERIRREILDRLREDHSIDASRVDVRVDGDCVRFEGAVPSEIESQVAEVIAREVDGVAQVENNLRVTARPGSGLPAASAGHSGEMAANPNRRRRQKNERRT